MQVLPIRGPGGEGTDGGKASSCWSFLLGTNLWRRNGVLPRVGFLKFSQAIPALPSSRGHMHPEHTAGST